MQLSLKNPIAFFDLETTGINISNDRIIEISILRVQPSGEETVFTSKVNPEMPIPAETTLIHGISDEDVKDQPTFKEIGKKINEIMKGCDLGGYNVLKFDLPMLVEEFLRANIDFDFSKRKVVDAQKIFFLMEKRNLKAAYKFYCNKELDGAHSAEADTRATYEVLKKQVERYEGSEVEDQLGNRVGSIENNISTLHQLTMTKMVDLAGRMVYNKNDVEVFNFGKHKGKPVMQVLQKEPSYYDWMMKGDFPLDTKRKLTEIKLRSFSR